MEFNFWKENKIANHFKLSDNEISKQFKNWLQQKETEWINYYSSDRIIRFFITDKTGLNSVHEENEFSELYNILYPVIIEAEKIKSSPA